MTKTIVQSACDRPVALTRGYFARFIGFFFGFGVCGLGGEFSMFRSISSARFNTSARGTSSDFSFCFRGIALFMVEPCHG